MRTASRLTAKQLADIEADAKRIDDLYEVCASDDPPGGAQNLPSEVFDLVAHARELRAVLYDLMLGGDMADCHVETIQALLGLEIDARKAELLPRRDPAVPV